MKSIVIAGRLTRDAETRSLNNGDTVLNFSVAVDDRQGKEKSTIFFDLSLFGKRGEALQQYLVKGQQVTASGDLSKREHDGKTYLTIRVNDVTLQGGKPESNTGGGTASGAASSRASSEPTWSLNDDVPFIRVAGDYDA